MGTGAELRAPGQHPSSDGSREVLADPQSCPGLQSCKSLTLVCTERHRGALAVITRTWGRKQPVLLALQLPRAASCLSYR